MHICASWCNYCRVYWDNKSFSWNETGLDETAAGPRGVSTYSIFAGAFWEEVLTSELYVSVLTWILNPRCLRFVPPLRSVNPLLLCLCASPPDKKRFQMCFCLFSSNTHIWCYSSEAQEKVWKNNQNHFCWNWHPFSPPISRETKTNKTEDKQKRVFARELFNCLILQSHLDLDDFTFKAVNDGDNLCRVWRWICVFMTAK